MCYYDLAISSSRLSNLSCKLLDHYLLSACMPHVTGHFCVCHVELWLLFHDFFPCTPVCRYLGTWVPGEPQGNHRGNHTGTREPVPWFPPYGSREPVPGSEMTGSPKFWFQYEYFPFIFVVSKKHAQKIKSP